MSVLRFLLTLTPGGRQYIANKRPTVRRQEHSGPVTAVFIAVGITAAAAAVVMWESWLAAERRRAAGRHSRGGARTDRSIARLTTTRTTTLQSPVPAATHPRSRAVLRRLLYVVIQPEDWVWEAQRHCSVCLEEHRPGGTALRSSCALLLHRSVAREFVVRVPGVPVPAPDRRSGVRDGPHPHHAPLPPAVLPPRAVPPCRAAAPGTRAGPTGAVGTRPTGSGT